MENNQALTPQQKKQYLMNKYVKRDYKVEDVELIKKYVLYFCPSLELVKEWTMVCVCDDLRSAQLEILWRQKFHETGDGDLVVDNDPRFSTFRDETKNTDFQGQTIEPGQELMNINYSNQGNMLQVIANSPVPANNNTSYKGLAYYAKQETEYQGFYEIREIYEIK